MDSKDPDSTEEENLWLPAHTELQTEKKGKRKKISCQNHQNVDGGRVETKKKKKKPRRRIRNREEEEEEEETEKKEES